MSHQHSPIGRANFIRLAALAGAAGIVLPSATARAAGPGAPPSAASSPAQALALLKEGDARFVAGKGVVCNDMTPRRVQLENGQSPFAAILSCSDSRVPVEQIFDQEPGNVFGVRVAGNFVDPNGLGSLEYSVAVLNAMLVVVLGHTACGAVKATVDYVKNGTKTPGHIQGLVTAIEPAVKATQGKPGDWVSNATVENVKMNVRAVSERSEILAQALGAKKIQVVGGVYDLSTGKVNFV